MDCQHKLRAPQYIEGSSLFVNNSTALVDDVITFHQETGPVEHNGCQGQIDPCLNSWSTTS